MNSTHLIFGILTMICGVVIYAFDYRYDLKRAKGGLSLIFLGALIGFGKVMMQAVFAGQ